MLIANKAPYVITVAGRVGYGLCKIAGEPRRISTSRSATLPELGKLDRTLCPVDDLVAFDLVGEHFRLLQEIIGSEKGAVVKTIGDAVMATFETPDRAIAAAIRMRKATSDLGAKRQYQSLHLKIGIHEGSCLAVTLNDQQDYFLARQ